MSAFYRDAEPASALSPPPRALGTERVAGTLRGMADRLCLWAAPAFALMALATALLGDDTSDMLCMSTQGASVLSGMVPMYLLMSAFHSAPWLKWLARRL